MKYGDRSRVPDKMGRFVWDSQTVWTVSMTHW